MQFIAEHPDAALKLGGAIILLLIGMIGYLYRQNETRSALIIANEIKVIGEKLDVLFKKDEIRQAQYESLNLRTSQLEAASAQQAQRCDDRAIACDRRHT